MKKFLLLTAFAFVTAALLSYTSTLKTPAYATKECYVSCFNADVREMARVDAADKTFASWHEAPKPFVLQNATGSTITFSAPDGIEASGYLIKAKKKTNNYLFVIQEWWGLNDYIKNEAEKLAAELGNVNVLAIDMYDGKVAATPDSAMKLMQGAKPQRLENIVKGAIAFAGEKAKIYTVGWCFGGMWSLQASIIAGKQAAGCIMYYGRPETNVEKLKTLNCDVIGFFGNLDKGPSPAMVDQFVKDMEAAGKKLTVNRYEAGHGFANPSNPRHNTIATADAFAKSIAFLKERLK
ncbi:MAG: dienelactone hydrolase family protein [Chitinophagaceae bacterium]|jgi:carboxymethylenebutenolidase